MPVFQAQLSLAVFPHRVIFAPSRAYNSCGAGDETDLGLRAFRELQHDQLRLHL
ncbi:hypothetical protein Q4S45_21450 [Massilia sp. R2A-15]|uniref:hypothetical protein n=1 Tax=Massilia sp. R2A-15 TaxID=3064278 RepID=UPI002735F45A|nr:hypothetical protein [Massilia sp. R2A-15]WLI89230.1 hypothetical protein Q4S45_21450 [Massilia sp. R2A-15]